MQYRTMPGAGEKLAVLGFGCMRLPTRGGRKSPMAAVDFEAATRLLRFAIDSGVNYLDTAYLYHMGASEEFLGKYALTDGYREKAYIATKLPCMRIFKKESMAEIFEKQLAKLRTGYIDYYLLHNLNGETWDNMLALGVVEFMDGLRKSGKVKHMGFSFHGTAGEFVKIADAYDWEFAQVQYNFVDEHFQAGAGGIEHAYRKGMGIVVMEPLRGGALVSNIPPEAQKLYDAAPVARSPAEWSLRWLLNNPAVTVVLSAMQTDAQITENIAAVSDAAAGGLSLEELAFVDTVRKCYLTGVGCTGCGYCMPCPAGIDIPGAFQRLNELIVSKNVSAKYMYMMNAGIRTGDKKPRWTTSCTNCGQCEKKCPQGVRVRESFKLVQKNLEGAGIRSMATIARRLNIIS